MIAKVAVAAANFAIDKPYSYRIPMGMELHPGVRVNVPFGRGNRPSEGVVLSLEQGEEDGLKPISQCLDDQPLLREEMLQLAAFLRERYFCTFFDAVRAMLPAGLWFRSKASYALTEDLSWQESNMRQKDGKKILEFLSQLGAEATEQQLLELIGEEETCHKAIEYLIRKKWIRCRTEYRRKALDKTEKIASLAVSPEEAMDYAQTRGRSAAMQRSVLEILCSLGSAPVKEICYYTGASSATVNRLAELGYVTLTEKPVLRCSEIRPVQPQGPVRLNESQDRVYQGLAQQLAQPLPGSALLYGVTGSGKTLVYLKLIRQCLDLGKAAVLLVPEIALTPQLLGILAGHFGDQVAVLHSSLSTSERYGQWRRVHAGEAKVVVGTRSAVFAPCPNLGLLILDEEQEHSYKSEQNPRYAAREVALWRGRKEKALVLLGSATPSVETMYHAQQGHHTLYTLPERYNGKPLPEVEIVDMREELRAGNDSSLSDSLRASICDNLDRGKQTILFLNRRGNSRALVCMQCGEAPECPRCSARLTYHSANERLMCHYCGFSQRVSRKCDRCGGSWKQVGVGTQKIQQELLELFPGTAVERMDTDTVTAANTHEMILSRFQRERIPILLGTQMVAKGLNLPEVTLVGVLDADLSLYNDSYRSAETTFNMITQVVGRAGRGADSGHAIIQTLTPGHGVLQLAARQDYDGFYELEIGMRRLQNAPPFGDLTQITFSGPDESLVIQGATKFRDSLLHCLSQQEYAGEPYTVLGPAPCPVPKVNYHYRFRITLRCRMNRAKRLLLAHLLRQFAKDKLFRGISAFADINGFD